MNQEISNLSKLELEKLIHQVCSKIRNYSEDLELAIESHERHRHQIIKINYSYERINTNFTYFNKNVVNSWNVYDHVKIHLAPFQIAIDYKDIKRIIDFVNRIKVVENQNLMQILKENPEEKKKLDNLYYENIKKYNKLLKKLSKQKPKNIVSKKDSEVKIPILIQNLTIDPLNIRINVNSSNPLLNFKNFKIKSEQFQLSNYFDPPMLVVNDYGKMLISIVIKSAMRNKFFIDDISRIFSSKNKDNKKDKDEKTQNTDNSE
jgi:hypothetical protein